MKRWKRPKNKKRTNVGTGQPDRGIRKTDRKSLWTLGENCFEELYQFLEDVTITAVNEAGSSDLFRWEWFTNNSGIFKDWSVGQDAYKYAVKSGSLRKYIHPEGFKTNHSAMQNELRGYRRLEDTMIQN